jgi:hypothetical protein
MSPTAIEARDGLRNLGHAVTIAGEPSADRRPTRLADRFPTDDRFPIAAVADSDPSRFAIPEVAAMQWVTREHPHTDRIACPWLIRRFIDAEAEIVYVPRDEVLSYAQREGAISFDAPGARYTHRDGLCTFEVLVDDHGLAGDPALALVARVVHGADITEDADSTPQSRGLEAIARGFMHLGLGDQEQLRLELPVYDALYAWAQREVADG